MARMHLKEGKISRVIVECFGSGEDVLERLNELVRKNHVAAGSFTALGTVEKANVGYSIADDKYSCVSLGGPLEVLSCVGNISLKDGAPFVHAHLTLANSEGRAFGGHLMAGCTVGATFEVTLETYD